MLEKSVSHYKCLPGNKFITLFSLSSAARTVFVFRVSFATSFFLFSFLKVECKFLSPKRSKALVAYFYASFPTLASSCLFSNPSLRYFSITIRGLSFYLIWPFFYPFIVCFSTGHLGVLNVFIEELSQALCSHPVISCWILFMIPSLTTDFWLLFLG